MTDKMQPYSFRQLLHAILSELEMSATVFGVAPGFRGSGGGVPLFGKKVEVPLGPAAGPHTQLAQNLVAAYVAGARFFELKTVQTLDGDDLPVSKPCILAQREGYNVEWSTELTVEQAAGEYIKGYYAISLLARELGLSGPDGFVFNMSVGYDFAGISSPKIDGFLNTLMDASTSPLWEECRQITLEFLPRLGNVDESYVAAIDPHISSSVTLSTLHGCPAHEIETIAAHLLTVKGLHTYVKCNPTLLGFHQARDMLDGLGYDQLIFHRHHFERDIQFDEAVAMISRLQAQAASIGLTFGVKVTNTFPVIIDQNQLPGEEMYLSGPPLAPLALAVAKKLTLALGDTLPISFSGGADAFHIGEIYQAGLWPITVATTLLKPGGYLRLRQLSKLLAGAPMPQGVSVEKLGAVIDAISSDPHHRRPLKSVPPTKIQKPIPLLDCFVAPCQESCPFGQDVTGYLRLMSDGRYRDALRVILDRNPLPHITGTICSHDCTTPCTRQFYDKAVDIRSAKLLCTQTAWSDLLPRLEPAPPIIGQRVAVVGGGPAGMATAFLLARRGVPVTLFEKTHQLGGVPRHVIPHFRIGQDALDKDASLLTIMGVDIRLNTTPPPAPQLLRQGYSHVALCVGAEVAGLLPLAGDQPISGLDFLTQAKENPNAFSNLTHVVVVGGGNVAMDAARCARKLPGTPNVTILYRRTVRHMPAHLEELDCVLADGITFTQLAQPISWENGTLTCHTLTLDPEGKGVPTGEMTLPAQLVVAAIGERVDGAALTQNGVTMDVMGTPILSSCLESGTRGVFVLGDAHHGPATVARAIADAHVLVTALLGEVPPYPHPRGRRGGAMSKKGKLLRPSFPAGESDRCLECSTLCECCVDVCPNRANVPISLLTRAQPQVLHLDALCNECGNCQTFCPYDGAPYREKFTLFACLDTFAASENPGFAVMDFLSRKVRVRLDGMVIDTSLKYSDTPLPSGVQELLETIFADYSFLLDTTQRS